MNNENQPVPTKLQIIQQKIQGCEQMLNWYAPVTKSMLELHHKLINEVVELRRTYERLLSAAEQETCKTPCSCAKVEKVNEEDEGK